MSDKNVFFDKIKANDYFIYFEGQWWVHSDRIKRIDDLFHECIQKNDNLSEAEKLFFVSSDSLLSRWLWEKVLTFDVQKQTTMPNNKIFGKDSDEKKMNEKVLAGIVSSIGKILNNKSTVKYILTLQIPLEGLADNDEELAAFTVESKFLHLTFDEGELVIKLIANFSSELHIKGLEDEIFMMFYDFLVVVVTLYLFLGRKFPYRKITGGYFSKITSTLNVDSKEIKCGLSVDEILAITRILNESPEQQLLEHKNFKYFIPAVMNLINKKNGYEKKVYYSLLFLGKSISAKDEAVKVILLQVSMEYLFSGRKQNQKRGVITAHIVSLISDNIQERESNQEIVSKFFELRNSIIHGESPRVSQDVLSEFVNIYTKAVFKEISVLNDRSSNEI